MKAKPMVVCVLVSLATPISMAIAAANKDSSPDPAAAAASGASSSGQESYAHKGFYLGAGATWAVQLFQDKVQDLTDQRVELGQTYGANARLGYRVTSWFSTEVDYEFLNGFKAEVAGSDALRFKGHAVTGDMKFHFIPVGPIQPNVLVGFGGMKYMINDDLGLGLKSGQWAFAARLGGGIDFYLTHHFLLNVEASAVLTTNDITDPTSTKSLTGLYYFSSQFGFQYRW